jgi:hypothetical protein
MIAPFTDEYDFIWVRKVDYGVIIREKGLLIYSVHVIRIVGFVDVPRAQVDDHNSVLCDGWMLLAKPLDAKT